MTLAELVAEQHDALVAAFVDAARALPGSEGVARVELLDSMAFFLDDLIEQLASGEPIARRRSAAATHGVERLSIGFRVDQVVREYALIARLVLELAAAHGVTPTAGELDLLLRATGDGAALAAAEYVRRQEADVMAREAAHAGLLAHELRNSLASARFAFDLLRQRGFREPDELAVVVARSLTGAVRQIDDALAGAQMRGGVVRAVRVLPRLIVDETVAELLPQAAGRGLRFEVDVPERLTLQADPRLTRSALANLLYNAVKFSHDGGAVTVRGRRHAGQLVVEVADECGGIEPERLRQLFRPFSRGDEARSGFGLGLGIARDAAEVQGGSVDARNRPDGRGCIFRLRLPSRS